MSLDPKQINTSNRLNRNQGLLQAGSPVTIDITTPAGQKGKFRTTFIGYLPKKYVLVQYPDANKLGNFAKYINQGSAITVRGLSEGHEGAVLAFISNVRQTLQIPSRMIVLDFPRTISLQNLRNSIRIDTEIVTKIKVANEYWMAVMTDISIDGCQLVVHNGESLSLDNTPNIEIIIDEYQGSKNISLSGERCNVKSLNSGISLGVQFSASSRDSVTKLMLAILTSGS